MSVFAPTNPEKIAERQLYEARRLLIEHQAAAEYHAAMVSMYGARVSRLTPKPPEATEAEQKAQKAQLVAFLGLGGGAAVNRAITTTTTDKKETK